jgi:hypothetical protein
MPSWIVPSDAHQTLDSGHTTDHNHIADDLTLVNTAVPAVSGGLPGVTAATRYVGGTASGAPQTGTFQAGDFFPDQAGGFWLFDGSSVPGAWKPLTPAGVAPSSMLVPMYIYPSPLTSWTTVNGYAPTVKYVVANASSGPGTTVDANYATAIANAQAAGVTVLGYVDTDYGAVSAATVEANIGLWQSLYGVTSVFFDRAATSSGEESYYATVCGYVTGKKVLNHGTIPAQGYAALADVLIVFENAFSSWSSFSPPSWFGQYPPSKFACFVYDAVGAGVMASVVTQAQQYGIGNIYVTDEDDDDFDALPTYLAAEVAQLKVPLSGYAAKGATLLMVLPTGDTAGADDVSAVNALIAAASTAGGGTVKGAPGSTFYFNAPFVLRSNVKLDMAGCEMNEVAGANCNMLSNAAVTAAFTGTGSMTSGGNTLTTSLATSDAVAGQSVYVAGGANGGANVLCGLVGTVNSGAGTLTIVDFYGNAVNAAANVSSGAVSLYSRDKNIAVTGGTWNRGNNGFNSSGSPLNCTTNLKRIDGLDVGDITFTCTSDSTHRGYNIHYGDCTNFSFRNITISAPTAVYNTDGINGHGPLAFGKIANIFGTCGDDLVSLQCLDSGLTEDSTGDISDVEVNGLYPDGNQSSALSIITLSTSCHMRRVTGKGIRGSSQFLAVQIGPLSPGAGTSWVDDILIEDVTNTAGGGLVSVYATYASGHIKLRDLGWTGNASTANGDTMVAVQSGTTLGSLTIDGQAIETATAETVGIQVYGTVGALTVRDLKQANSSIVTASAGMIIINGGTVDVLSIEGAHLLMSTSSAPVVYVDGTAGAIHFQDVYLSGSGALLLATQEGNPAAQVLLANVTLNGAGYLIDAESALNVTYANLNLQSLHVGNVIWLGNSTSVVSVHGRGLINPGNTTMFGYGSGAPAPQLVDDTHPLETPVTQPAALYFNGSSSYATAADASSLDITGSVSLEAWINPLPSQEDFWTPAGKSGQYWLEGSSSGAPTIAFNIQSGGINRSSGAGTLIPGRMNHVVGTFNASNGEVFLFVNGSFSNGGTYAVTTVDTGTDPFYLGNRQTFSRFFGGQMTDVRLWSGALSSVDATDHYLNPGDLGNNSSSVLAARWKLDEGTGTTLNDGSGNGNTGTLSSGTWIPPYTPYATQPVLATGASHTVDDVITVLQNLGLVVQ